MSRAGSPTVTDREWRFREERTYSIPESWADNGRHEVADDDQERYYAVQVKLGVSLQWGVDDTGSIVDGPHRDKPTVRVCYVARDSCSAYVRDWDAVIDDGRATPERDFASILAIEPADANPVEEESNREWFREILSDHYDVTPVVADGGQSTDGTEYDCGFCDWTHTTTSFREGAVETMRHYNYQHSIQSWLYRKLRSVVSDIDRSGGDSA